jgi:hypothetical protein
MATRRRLQAYRANVKRIIVSPICCREQLQRMWCGVLRIHYFIVNVFECKAGEVLSPLSLTYSALHAYLNSDVSKHVLGAGSSAMLTRPTTAVTSSQDATIHNHSIHV